MSTVVLYGSETGTAEIVADDIATVLGGATVEDMFEFEADSLDADNFYVVVCSTYGSGELPTGAEPFYESLEENTPDLTGLHFAVFGLGDKVYEDTFNRGGEIMAEKLTELGATQVGEHARHDASSTVSPRDMAKEWAATIVPLAERVGA